MNYCECDTPDEADGYAVTGTGVLKPEVYCETCGKPCDE